MTEKRYFKRMWEGEYYIFDSYTISEKDFDEKVEYEDYQAFADSMTGEEVTDRLNKYDKEYRDCYNDVLRLEKENEKLKNRLKFFMELNKPYGDIIKENEQLKQSNKDAWNLIQFIYEEIKKDGSMDWGRIQDLVEF